MTSEPTTTPPATGTESGTGWHRVLVRLDIPRVSAVQTLLEGAPETNRIAVELLARLCVANLQLADIRTGEFSNHLPLERGLIVLQVDRPGPALDVLKRTLAEAGLLAGTKLAWWHPVKSAWLAHHPDAGPAFPYPEEELAREDAWGADLRKQLTRQFPHLERLDETGGSPS